MTNLSSRATPFRRSGEAPLYQELARWLEKKVLTGEYPKGSRIPGDLQLAADLRLSVITVRAALRALRDKHLIARYPGKGTFVLDHSSAQHTWGIGSTEDLVAMGRQSVIKLLAAGYVHAPEDIAGRFEQPEGSKIFRCRTLRLSEGEPFVVTDVYLPASIGKAIEAIDLDAALQDKRLVHMVVEGICRIFITDIRQTMGAELATKGTARILRVASGTPLLTVEREYFTSEGTLVQIGRASHRVDHYQYATTLKRVTPRLS